MMLATQGIGLSAYTRILEVSANSKSAHTRSQRILEVSAYSKLAHTRSSLLVSLASPQSVRKWCRARRLR